MQQPERYVQAGVDAQDALHRLEEVAGRTMANCPAERRAEFRALVADCLGDMDDEEQAQHLREIRFLSPDLDVAMRVVEPVRAFRSAEALCKELGVDATPPLAALLERGRALIGLLELPVAETAVP